MSVKLSSFTRLSYSEPAGEFVTVIFDALSITAGSIFVTVTDGRKYTLFMILYIFNEFNIPSGEASPEGPAFPESKFIISQLSSRRSQYRCHETNLP